MLVRTNAIVLRRLRYSDTSIIATLLTEQRGVESILAKGARSPKSRMAAVLEPLEQIDVQYYVKPGRELQLLRAAERTVLRRSIQSSYEHTVAALRIAELVLRLELPGHPHAEVYELVEQTLAALDAAQSAAAFPVAFALRYAAVHGFSLQLDVHDALPPLNHQSQPYILRLDRGTFEPVLLDLAHRGSHADEVSSIGTHTLERRTLATLQTLGRTPLERLGDQQFESGVLEECRGIVERYLEFHFERRLRRG